MDKRNFHTRYPQIGETWELPKGKFNFAFQVRIIHTDDIHKDIFGKVIVKPLDGGFNEELTILDFLDNGFIPV